MNAQRESLMAKIMAGKAAEQMRSLKTKSDVIKLKAFLSRFALALKRAKVGRKPRAS